MRTSVVFEGRDFERVARGLASDTREAEVRSAIGRTYYACFLHTRTFLESQGAHFREGRETHGDVGRGIAEWDKRLYGKLTSLHDLRKDSDYSIPFDGNLQTSLKTAFRLSAEILRGIDRLIAEQE
jgi:hypothetical protein